MAVFEKVSETPDSTFRVMPGTMGLVVKTESQSERIMSDVWASCLYAVVMDPTDLSFKKVFVSDDEGSKSRYCEIDAEPETLDRYAAALLLRAAEAAERKLEEEVAQAVSDLSDIEKGREVKVVRGVKVPKGTTGRVFWIGSGRYGTRLGLKTAAGETVWVDARNCETIVPAGAAEAAEKKVREGWVGKAAREARKAAETAVAALSPVAQAA